MNKYIAILLVSIYISGCISFPNEEVAFIGEPLAAERTEESCEKYVRSFWERSGIQEICMNSVFKLQYQINEPLKGNVSEGPINFIGFNHYRGMPSYIGLVDALIILKRVNFGYVLEQIEWVHEKDDQWFACEEWSEDDSECLKYVSVQSYLAKFNK